LAVPLFLPKACLNNTPSTFPTNLFPPFLFFCPPRAPGRARKGRFHHLSLSFLLRSDFRGGKKPLRADRLPFFFGGPLWGCRRPTLGLRRFGSSFLGPITYPPSFFFCVPRLAGLSLFSQGGRPGKTYSDVSFSGPWNTCGQGFPLPLLLFSSRRPGGDQWFSWFSRCLLILVSPLVEYMRICLAPLFPGGPVSEGARPSFSPFPFPGLKMICGRDGLSFCSPLP